MGATLCLLAPKLITNSMKPDGPKGPIEMSEGGKGVYREVLITYGQNHMINIWALGFNHIRARNYMRRCKYSVILSRDSG